MSRHNTQSQVNNQITSSKWQKDKDLDDNLIQLLYDISDLQVLLDRYLHQDDSRQTFKRIQKVTFFNQFKRCSGLLKLHLDSVLKYFEDTKHKHLSDEYIAGRITDPNAGIDKNYFHLHFHVIGDAFNHFINEIEIQEKETSFKNNWFLNGNASYLYEMLFDLSSFTGFFYAYKRDEYARYDGAKRLENIKVINPDSYLLFLGNRRIPSSEKTHRSSSIELLETSSEIMLRNFYRDNVHVIPVTMSILRQMIEIKMIEIYGIRQIFDAAGKKIVNIGGTRLLSLPGILDDVIFPIKVDVLKNIYAWACGYVHRGISSDYWTIYYVKNVLADFVCGETYMYKDFSNNLASEIAKAANTDAAHVVLGVGSRVEIISDRIEFDKLKLDVQRRGYKKASKEREEEFEKMLIERAGIGKT